MGAPCRLDAEARLRSRCQLSLTPPLPLANLTAFGHPGGGMDMENLAETLKGNPMLQQAMADNPEMQELLNNPAALQEKMAAAQATHSALRCTPSRPGPRFTQRPPAACLRHRASTGQPHRHLWLAQGELCCVRGTSGPRSLGAS